MSRRDTHKVGRIVNGEPDLSGTLCLSREYDRATMPDTYQVNRGKIRPLKTLICEEPRDAQRDRVSAGYIMPPEEEPDADGVSVSLIVENIKDKEWCRKVHRPIKIIVY